MTDIHYYTSNARLVLTFVSHYMYAVVFGAIVSVYSMNNENSVV